MGAIAPETNNSEVNFTLKAVPENVRMDRDLTDVTLMAWCLRHLMENARLNVSELLTNAAAETPGRDVYLLISREGSTVCLGVWDPSPNLPVMGPNDPLAESGRGLFMVAALANGHGPCRVGTPPGKVAWARLRV